MLRYHVFRHLTRWRLVKTALISFLYSMAMHGAGGLKALQSSQVLTKWAQTALSQYSWTMSTPSSPARYKPISILIPAFE